MNQDFSPHNASDTSNIPRIQFLTKYINIKKLERETNRVLALGFLVSILFHASIFMTITYKRTEVRVPKPIKVELVIRKPRMTKPFMIDKRTIVKRLLRKQYMQRMPTGSFKFRDPVNLDDLFEIVDSFNLDVDPITVAEIIAEIDSTFDKEIQERFGGDVHFEIVTGFVDTLTRIDPRVLSFKENLLNLDDLDTGDYKALVIKDPKNVQALQGFVYIPVDVWGSPSALGGSDLAIRPAAAVKNAIQGLSAGLAKYTGIKLKTDRHLNLDTGDMNSYPFVYLTADQLFEVTENQIRNIREYLADGGFLCVEPYSPDGMREINGLKKTYYPLRSLIENALGYYGDIRPIPSDHPLFRCYYDLNVAETLMPEPEDKEFHKKIPLVMGIWYDNRLVGVFSDREWGRSWASYNYENPNFRLGVNMVVYSLIRQDSPTQQYITDGR